MIHVYITYGVSGTTAVSYMKERSFYSGRSAVWNLLSGNFNACSGEMSPRLRLGFFPWYCCTSIEYGTVFSKDSSETKNQKQTEKLPKKATKKWGKIRKKSEKIKEQNEEKRKNCSTNYHISWAHCSVIDSRRAYTAGRNSRHAFPPSRRLTQWDPSIWRFVFISYQLVPRKGKAEQKKRTKKSGGMGI